jgi:hypothetical protein
MVPHTARPNLHVWPWLLQILDCASKTVTDERREDPRVYLHELPSEIVVVVELDFDDGGLSSLNACMDVRLDKYGGGGRGDHPLAPSSCGSSVGIIQDMHRYCVLSRPTAYTLQDQTGVPQVYLLIGM